MSESTQPAERTGLRTYTAEGEAESLERHLKRAVIKGREFFCDEGKAFGGDDAAPGSMDYFIAAIMF